MRDNDYLSEMGRRKKLHTVQALPKHKDATFVGDAKCVDCHAAEMDVWKKSKHAAAYDALAKDAPSARPAATYDGECIICHTVGYEYQDRLPEREDDSRT